MRFRRVLAVIVLALAGLVVAWRLFGQYEVRRAGPLVVQDAAWWPPFDQGGLDALISGELRIEDDCAYLGDSVVLWPNGTEWVDEESAVRLPDGDLAHEGDRVEGGGGFFGGPEDGDTFEDSPVATAIGECRDPGDEIARFNTREHLEVRPAG